jgi:hypothetical protein
MGLIDSINGAESAPPDNARAAFEYYVSQGLTPVQAAGIVGNLQGESGQGLNPNAVNRGDGRDGSDSIGVGQWNSTRAQALKEFAASKGVPWNDLNTQLEFLHQELKGPERGAYDRLIAAKTPEEAGQAMLAFERPKDWNKPGAHPERGQYAARVFSTYAGGQLASAPQAAVTPPGAPLQIAPQRPPIFPPAPQPQAQPQQAGGLFEQMPADQQVPPIFFPQRRAPDLSKLRAAFKAPVFSRG